MTTVTLHHGDNRESLRRLIDQGIRVHSVVTDPPYGLTSITKRFGKDGAAPALSNGATGVFGRASAGFMGSKWDGTGIERDPEFWRLIWEILLPGGYVVAFSGSRTGHWQACAMEMAGFIMHPMIGWVTGSGFPKAHNVDRYRGDLICGCESATECDMRPMWDTDVSSTQPHGEERGQVLQQGMSQQSAPAAVQQCAGDVRRGQPSMERRGDSQTPTRELRVGEVCQMPGSPALNGAEGRLCDGASAHHGGMGGSTAASPRDGASRGSQPSQQREVEPRIVPVQSQSQDGGAWSLCDRCNKPVLPRGLGYGGQALKPALEPIFVGQKPFSEKNGALNILKHGVGAINIDACRNGTTGARNNGRQAGTNGIYGHIGATTPVDYGKGRHPANLLHDGSAEVVALFPNDSGRFFNSFPPDADPIRYQAKATKGDRAGSKHPTVKPIPLIEWLVTLVTPPGGTVLDPFAGSGTTGQAAKNLGFDSILMEAEGQFAADIRRRFDLASHADDDDFDSLIDDDDFDNLLGAA